MIITNSKAKKKGAHFEHLNYHLLSILIVVYHDLFPFDKTASRDKVVLIDASKLGEKIKVDGNQKTVLHDEDVDKIINTFHNAEVVDDFSVVVNYDEIKEKNYSLSAGQYFDIKIEYIDITEDEFNKRMADYQQTLTEQFAESHRLEEEILNQLKSLKFNG